MQKYQQEYKKHSVTDKLCILFLMNKQYKKGVQKR